MRKSAALFLFFFCLVFLFGCAAKDPVLYAPDLTIHVGEECKITQDVRALDAQDGDLTEEVRVTAGELDTTKAGRNRISYEVTNSRGHTAQAVRTIRVVPKGAHPLPLFLKLLLPLCGAILAYLAACAVMDCVFCIRKA